MAVISATGSIREEIASRLNELETDNTDIYTNWINLTLRDIANTFPNAPWLQTSADFTLSSGTRVYPALISNAEKVNTITYPGSQTKLQFFSPEEFDIVNASATQGGNPTYFTIRGYLPNGRFEFYPVPGSSITIHADYQKTISSVSLAADLPEIPLKYYELLILGGEMKGLRRQRRYDEVKMVSQEYEAMKQMMMQDMMRQTSQMPRVKSVREYQFGNQITTDPIANQFFSNQF